MVWIVSDWLALADIVAQIQWKCLFDTAKIKDTTFYKFWTFMVGQILLLRNVRTNLQSCAMGVQPAAC